LSRVVQLGYWLSCEEHAPSTLVDNAVAAEQAGFRLAMASDHFHPWVPAQGQAPLVWPVLGAIAHATSELALATGVSSTISRIHPLLLAQAASTISAMAPGRFTLGLGLGERLNEQITGAPWPRPGVRRRMLCEAIEILRPLLNGEEVNHEGEHFTVQHAQLFTRAAAPPPIWLAVAGPRTAQVAGERADGMIGVAPVAAQVEAFEKAGGAGKPVVGQLHVCLAPSVDAAVATVARWWPQQALPSALLGELSRPRQFAAAAELLDDARLRKAVVCCDGPGPILDGIAAFGGAGYTRVMLHQVGPDQERFLQFAQSELLPS
jgi:G6PDH family F420-dependent oxidoreductase